METMIPMVLDGTNMEIWSNAKVVAIWYVDVDDLRPWWFRQFFRRMAQTPLDKIIKSLNFSKYRQSISFVN